MPNPNIETKRLDAELLLKAFVTAYPDFPLTWEDLKRAERTTLHVERDANRNEWNVYTLEKI